MSSRSRSLRDKGIPAIVLAALLAPGAALADPAAAPPDGSYSYTISQAGQKIGSTALTVTRNGAGVTSHEVETITGLAGPITVDQSLDPSALTPTGYMASPCRLNPQVAVTAHLTFDSSGANETVDGTSGSTHFPMESGTSHIVVLDGAFMTGFAFLPAQVKAQSLSTFTGLATCAATSLVYAVAPSTASRPSSVPSSDSSLTVNGTINNTTVGIVEWYDPHAMVVDEVDVPAQQVTITRQR
jgi:hypothetical protein